MLTQVLRAPKYVSIEGLVGGGKTTLLENLLPRMRSALQHKGSVVEISEPVNEWIETGILEKSYQNPKQWAFPAQCTFFHSRIKAVRKSFKENPNAAFFISERSPFSDTLFWELQPVDPLLKSMYYDMWTMWQDLMPQEIRQPHLFIYLRPSLEECMRRMQERAREAEKGVSVEYQQKLLESHQKHFHSETRKAIMPDGTQIPVLVIEGNGNFRDDKQVANKIADQVIERVLNL
eukprot:Lithocolla_globosa_v1_NODE_9121_length_742_cov_8.215429.p1 type:complete len:234 gc:universal NODE_9121_length_742_cov_8.215429:37-738(+)